MAIAFLEAYHTFHIMLSLLCYMNCWTCICVQYKVFFSLPFYSSAHETDNGAISIKWDYTSYRGLKKYAILCIHIVQSRHFKSATDNHKKSFFRSVNAIFGKVGRIATDDVILQLVFFKVYTRVIVWFSCVINSIWCEITRLYLQPFHDKVI